MVHSCLFKNIKDEKKLNHVIVKNVSKQTKSNFECLFNIFSIKSITYFPITLDIIDYVSKK